MELGWRDCIIMVVAVLILLVLLLLSLAMFTVLPTIGV